MTATTNLGATILEVTDPRLARVTNNELHAVVYVEGLDELATSILLGWLPPFLSVRLIPAQNPLPTEWSWYVRISTEPADRKSGKERFDLVDGEVILARESMPERMAAAVVRVCRALFKALAIRLGGVNLHAACLVRGQNAVLLTGARGAGKTSVMLRGLATGLFDFLANDQVIVVRRPDGLLSVWGYPALVRVRSTTRDLAELGPPLLTEPDTLPGVCAGPSSLYLPRMISRALGTRTLSTARPVLGLVYERTEHDARLTTMDGDIASTLWHNTAALPMRMAYSNRLVKLVEELTGFDPSRHTQADFGLRCISVVCGESRIDDLLACVASSIDDEHL